jgi:hypothetical protein
MTLVICWNPWRKIKFITGSKSLVLKMSMHCEINTNLKGLIDARVIYLEGNMFAKTTISLGIWVWRRNI